MRVIALDTSGGIPADAIAAALNDIQVGDYVLMFDTRVYPQGVMQSRDQIASMPFMGRGGTLIAPVLDHIDELESVSEIVIYTDGYFCAEHDARMASMGIKLLPYKGCPLDSRFA